MSWLSDLFGGDKGTETSQSVTYSQLPGYEDVNKLRETATGKLQQWANMPGYGAIAPNWNDIWDLAKKRVQQYYWGTPTDPGMIAKLNADAARKGQSGQPAYVRNLSRLGQTESDQLSSMAVEQAMNEAQFAESGRQNWIKEALAFQAVKPDYKATSTTSTSKDLGGGEGQYLLGNLFGTVTNTLGQKAGNWLSDLIPKGLGAIGSTLGIPDVGSILGGMGKATVGGNPNDPNYINKKPLLDYSDEDLMRLIGAGSGNI